MTKRLAAAILSFCLFLGAFGCAPSQEAGSTADIEAPVRTPGAAQEALLLPAGDGAHKIAVIAAVESEEEAAYMRAALEEYAFVQGLQISLHTAPEDEPEALAALAAAQTDADALCLLPAFGTAGAEEALQSAVRDAKGRGVAVLAQAQGALAELADFTLLSADTDSFGAAAMDALAASMAEDGLYTSVVGVGMADAGAWLDSAVLHQHQVYPGMQLLQTAMRVQVQDAQGAYERARALLTENPELKGFLCANAALMEGVGRAVEELELRKQVHLACAGSPAGVRAAASHGLSAAALTCDKAQLAKALCALARLSLEGKEAGAHTDLGVGGYQDLLALDESGRRFAGQGFALVNAQNADGFGY